MAGEFRKYVDEAFRQMDAGPAHPAAEKIAAYVRGQLGEPARSEVNRHLAGCARCLECAAEFKQFLQDTEGPAKAPPGEIDLEYRKLARRIRPRIVSMPPRWIGVAAGIVAAAGLAAALYRVATPSTPRLLAEAYRERRSSELRIAGAGYAELRQERAGGSAFSMPASLLKAQSRIKDDLQSHANDPELLRLEGEAEMEEGEAAAAVETLRRARGLRPNDAKTLADLGAAYVMLGDAEHDYGDYKTAIDFLEQAVRLDPGNLEAKFNRAVTLEKLMLYAEAETDWESYLKSDPTSGWAAEARKRLDAVKEILRRHGEKRVAPKDDPSYFLRLADASQVDSEAWLKSDASSAWLERAANDDAARRAASRLAGLLASEHGDTWFQDMMAAPCLSTDSSEAVKRLMEANSQANDGGYGAALGVIEETIGAFGRAGCKAGVARARSAQLTMIRNLVRPGKCLEAGNRLDAGMPRSYVLLRVGVTRETAICALQLGEYDDGATKRAEALAAARAANYGAAALRVATDDLDATRSFGAPSQTLERAWSLLRMFWTGTYDRTLSFVPFIELRGGARDGDEKYAALHFARAEVWATSGANAIATAQIWAYGELGVAERELGDSAAARGDLENASRIALKTPDEYNVSPATSLARLDLDDGNPSGALERLLPLTKAAQGMSWEDRAYYYPALGEAFTRSGRSAEAMEAFGGVIGSATAYLKELRSEEERGFVLKSVESAYRGMVETQLAAPGNEETALATWQAFRDFDAPRDAIRNVQDKDAALWFVELRDGYAAWFTRAGQTRYHHIGLSKAAIAAAAQRFLEECGSGQSSEASLRTQARDIYRWLIEPFSAELAQAHGNLVFELDGSLTSLPLEALVTTDGGYLGDRFAIVVSSGRARRPYSEPGTNAKVLIVANPAIGGASAERFPPLPDSVREAEAIRQSFGNNTFLEGRGATLAAMKAALPGADILHFAGHGYSASGNGGLLFAPEDSSTADFRLLRAAEMNGLDWSRCSLAVLSACAAAEGETHGAHNPESLVRALAKAGAPRIAASLWNVDSAAAAELMSQFYLGLKMGKGVGESLRAARQAVRANGRWSHPYYWAGFQLYGAT